MEHFYKVVPPIKSIANVFLYLFQDRKLQPSTIDGYRSSIAEKLGNLLINIRKDENFTCVLDSFHRDRPNGRRGIPSWNFSLVLHQLTKTPFEPLKKASLKYLTLKTVYILALGLASTERDPFLAQQKHQTSTLGPRYLCTPHPVSKTYVAKEGPEDVATVFIQALAYSG